MSLVDRLIGAAIRAGRQRGLRQGSRGWLVVGAVALAARLVRRALHREPEVVFSEELRPGESVRVSHEARA